MTASLTVWAPSEDSAFADLANLGLTALDHPRLLNVLPMGGLLPFHFDEVEHLERLAASAVMEIEPDSAERLQRAVTVEEEREAERAAIVADEQAAVDEDFLSIVSDRDH